MYFSVLSLCDQSNADRSEFSLFGSELKELEELPFCI